METSRVTATPREVKSCVLLLSCVLTDRFMSILVFIPPSKVTELDTYASTFIVFIVVTDLSFRCFIYVTLARSQVTRTNEAVTTGTVSAKSRWPTGFRARPPAFRMPMGPQANNAPSTFPLVPRGDGGGALVRIPALRYTLVRRRVD